jgi:hypothetical protein
MSVVSSTERTVDNYHSNYHPMEESKEILSRSDIAYGYISDSGSSGLPEGPCYFYLDDPGNLYSLAPTESTFFLSGGTWTSEEIWYGCEYATGSLWTINPNNGDMTNIGGGGTSCNGLAWDPVYNRLYGASDSGLYEYDPETGEQELICSFSVSWYPMGIAFDGNGTLYGWFDNLWIMEACKGTFVGPLGIWAGDGHFDYDTDILYLSTYISTGQLYECDVETGNCTLIGNFEGGAEITCLAIPFENDTTPPITTHTLDPSEPDGLNGWYVSDVNVTLTATDDLSGVKEIRYWVNGGSEQVIPGDNGSFILDEDCWNGIIEYWAIDNAGNVETPKNSFTIYIDQTVPDISITYEHEYFPYYGWTVVFTVTATDAMSGMDYVEFYDGGVVQETVYGPGPEYEWIWNCANLTHIIGLIRKPVVSESNVSFYSITVITIEDDWDKFKYFGATAYDNAGNSESDEILSHFYYPPFFKLLQFQNLTLPNNYRGYIGRNFIFARFNTSQVN